MEAWDPLRTDGIFVTTNNSGNGNVDNNGIGLIANVKDPNGNIILSRSYGRQGRFAFTSHTSGDHTICLASNDTSMEGILRTHVDINIGGMAVDYDIVKKKEKLTELQLTLRKLQDLTQQISKEQNYQRNREYRFRQTSESTNNRVIFFAILQTVLLVAIGLYQVHHLKIFFIMKKLV